MAYEALMAAAAGVAATSFSIVWNASVNLRNKRMDVILQCNKQYDELRRHRLVVADLCETKGPNDPGVIRESDEYYRSYFGLKSNQLDYWLAGYVDPETLTSWFISTVDAMETPASAVGSETYVAAWTRLRRRHEEINPVLVQLIDGIVNDVCNESDRRVQYARLHRKLRDVERSERPLIGLLTSMWNHRPSMGDLEYTLSPRLRREIGDARDGGRRSSSSRRGD